MNKYYLFALMCFGAITAKSIDVKTIRYSQACPIVNPLITDSLDANGNKIDLTEKFFSTPVSVRLSGTEVQVTDSILPACEKTSLQVAGFTIENTGFVKCKVNVGCKSRYTFYLNGNESGQDIQLVPGRHEVSLKLLRKEAEADTLKISIDSEQEKYITINPEGKRYWTNSDLMNGERLSSTSLSSTGKYMLQNRHIIRKDGSDEWSKEIIELSTGNRIAANGFMQWAAKDDRYIRTSRDVEGATVYESVDIKTGKTTLLGKYKGRHNAHLIADDTKLLIYENVEGPKEQNDAVHQVLMPDDRQPGWRNRNNMKMMDLKTGVVRNLTAGAQSSYVTPNSDATKFLVSIRKEDITRRPFGFTTVLLLDAETMKADTIIKEDGFIHSCDFSPNGEYISIIGSPECLNGIGNTLPKDKIPNSYEYELYLMNAKTFEVKCLTRDFYPSIQEVKWCKADGNMYARVENRDHSSLCRINPKNGKIDILKTSEPFVFSNFDIAEEKPLLSYVGQSTQHSDRTWIMDLKSGKETMVNDINPVRLDNIQLGECHDWNFKAERGDTIYGCYYLPPYFDESKQYPMLVYYYGGCSPVGRYLDSYYNYQEWAAMGYVVYVLQPSGCSGFGQEFASRHVNAYGDYTADDIIQGTKQFCKEHPYVNDKKIGCMGASYGGFMTMYLQTVTDIFAAAMSHAGISNPTSYWGFGYWGYSYSTVSAADSYPWNNMELYSGHAPLFRADKVHTPLLFMHGGADTNVPINESIQMFTALKILDRETAFITVDGENHHILDYNKRIRWHDSIMAWFARWLQDDPTWWNSMYPEKNL